MHYHANHVGSPARATGDEALRDAQALQLNAMRMDGWIADPAVVGSAQIRAHGAWFPFVIRCYNDCPLVR